MPKVLSNGNLALIHGAITWAIESAGPNPTRLQKFLFAAGYPITPVNEVTEYLSRITPEVDACFIQAESEIAS
ncbi:MAG: hypothetical protein HYZ87_00115, partial [Candidatus Omnitrophica bacterium]|nr:hypothetical protein [Candidatus Omnitrophota bacterium]